MGDIWTDTLNEVIMSDNAQLTRVLGDVAARLTAAGYASTIEHPCCLHIVSPTDGEILAAGTVNGTWGIDSSPGGGNDGAETELDGDHDNPAEIAAALLDVLDDFTDKGTYPTAAARRKADADEAEARNHGR